ncbi:MAG: DUF4350 domain-containing protein [Pseudomonadota bacterium]
MNQPTAMPSTFQRGVWALLGLGCFIGLGTLSHFIPTRIDLTASGQNSAHPVVAELLAKFADPIVVQVATEPHTGLAQHIRTLIARYQSVKPDITLDIIDPKHAPERVRDLALTSDSDWIITTGERTTRAKRFTDQAFANALVRLGRTDARKIRTLRGHGERSLVGRRNDDLGLLGQALSERGFDVGELALTELGEIPTDVSVLVLSPGRSNWLPDEQAAVRTFLDNGGNALVLGEPTARTEQLSDVLSAFGLLIEPIAVIESTKAQANAGTVPKDFLVLRDYPPHPSLADFDSVTLFPQIAAIRFVKKTSWQNQRLLAAGYSSSRVTAPGDANGTLVGVASTRGAQRAIVLGDGDFAANQYLGNGGNLALAVRFLEWLAEEEARTIPPRLVPDPRLDVAPTTLQAIALVTVVLIPLALIAIGIGRWMLRQRH